MAALQLSMQAVIQGELAWQSKMITRRRRRSNVIMINLKTRSKGLGGRVLALDHRSSSSSSDGGAGSVNYVVPMDQGSSFSCITSRPLVEILRDLNKRIPDNIILNSKPGSDHPPPPPPPIDSDSDSPPPPTAPPPTFITWYHANRMLSFYAPGWCGEIRDVIFSDAGSVTVVYRVTIRGSDGEAHRESTGTVLAGNTPGVDPVAAAEELAFCRACARFGLGLYLYHEE